MIIVKQYLRHVGSRNQCMVKIFKLKYARLRYMLFEEFNITVIYYK